MKYDDVCVLTEGDSAVPPQQIVLAQLRGQDGLQLVGGEMAVWWHSGLELEMNFREV